MIFNADLFDYVWKSLLTATIGSTVILSVVLMVGHFARARVANAKMKAFFNLHAALLLLSTAVGSIVLIHADPELASACFSHFAERNGTLNVTRLLAGAYLSVVFVMLGLDVIRTLLAYGKIRSLREVDDGDGAIALRDLVGKLGLKPSTSLAASPETQSPFAWGLFSHRIVVSEALLKDPANLRAILAHEAIHVKDQDSLWMLLSHLSKRLLFFHPLAHLFEAQHRLVTEMTADEGAVRDCGIQKRQLLNALIANAERCAGKTGVLMQAHASQGFRELSERIHAITADRKQKRSGFFTAIVAASLLACSLVAIAQARASLAPPGALAADGGERMCSQVKHEKIIEVWLSLGPSPDPSNKCELK